MTDSKLNVMESIALRQRHKLESIKQSIEHRLKKLNTRGSTLIVEEDFLKEILKEIENE